MSLSISIDEKQLTQLAFRLVKLSNTQIALATKQALNKTLPKMRGLTQKRIGLQLALKKKDIKKGMTERKAFGADVNTMRATLNISGKSISLLKFVKGDKSPRSTKAKSIKSRRPLKIEVKKGRTLTRRDVFIIKGSGGKNIVVRRQKAKQARPLGGRESVTALPTITRRPGVSNAILKLAQKRLHTEIIRSIDFQLSKLKR